MNFPSRISAGIFAAAIFLSGWMGTAHAAQAIIDQSGLKFVPNTITINAGDTILFKNSDPYTHDVTIVSANGTRSDKGLQHHGQDRVVTFPDEGTFSVVCTMHPNMKATVTVK